MNNEMTRRLTDTSTAMGMAFSHDIGKIWALDDKYDDDSVRWSPVMEQTMKKLAYNFYIAGATEEVAIESALR
jgi:hypothetical protein